MTAINAFLLPFLQKGGEKLVEKSVELAFDSRRDLLDKFRSIFHDEIVTLNLDQSSSEDEISSILAKRPEVLRAIESKVAQNENLLSELVEVINQSAHETGASVTINANKIGQVVNSPQSTVVQHIENL